MLCPPRQCSDAPRPRLGVSPPALQNATPSGMLDAAASPHPPRVDPMRPCTHPHFISMAGLLVILLMPGMGAGQAMTERAEASTPVRGVVYLDRNTDGQQDPGEPGLEGVLVSDQDTVVSTDAEGRFSFDSRAYGLVQVIQPSGCRAVGSFWKPADNMSELQFGLTPWNPGSSWTFLHASDLHLDQQSLPRLRRLRAMVDSLRPAFVLLTGDLVRDGLRVQKEVARGYYDLLETELDAFPVPVYTVPGNHELFGIEREKSGVASSHPLYGNRMYRAYRGPNYYAFSAGTLLFLGLDTVDYDDMWYHGHVDALQRDWLSHVLAATPPGARAVAFNNIPFASSSETRLGYTDGGAAPTLLRTAGRTVFRHTVYNHEEVLGLFGPGSHPLEIALAGHIHLREAIEYRTQQGPLRLHQAAAAVGPARGSSDGYGPLSGVTLYRVTKGRVDNGTFLPLDPMR